MFENFSYTQYFDPAVGDPTITHLPLLGYPTPICIITVIYLILVLKVGPSLMRNKPPYNLKYILLVYNFAQIVLNFWIGYAALQIQLYYNAYDLGCCRTLPPIHPQKSLEIWTSYAYYIMKLVDLVDTVFFVLRKSTKQITFLHIYHHLLMINATYVALHFCGSGGETYSIVVLNSFVHSFMYAYYLVTAVFPSLRSFATRWKKYITLMQLMQFVIILLQNAYTLLFRSDCDFSRFNVFNVVQSTILIALFGSFYKRAYPRNKSAKGSHEN